jgi:tetratricopeptide (TPR) repeat protein
LQVIVDIPKHQANLLQTLVQRNWALLAMKNYADVQNRVDKLLSRVRHPDLLMQDAVLKLIAKDVLNARKAFEEALKLRPTDVRALQAIAATYVMQKDAPVALSFVREHAKWHENSSPIQALCGRWMFQFGDYAAARHAYSIVRKLEADPVPVDLMLAEIDRAEGKLHEARQRLAALVSMPSVTANVFNELGNIDEALKDRDSAIRNYRKAVELDPRHSWALNNLAFLLADHAGGAHEALKYAQKAMEALPENSVIEDTLGWVYYRNGSYNLAVKHLENAVGKGGGPATRYHLAAAYAKAGQSSKAENALRAALKTAPDIPEAAVAREVVASSAVNR